MGFGSGIFFFLGLGVLVLGPKRLHVLIGHMARARARFQEIAETFKFEVVEELDREHPEGPKPSL